MIISDIVELLDSSQDAETIALEIVSNEALNSELGYVTALYLGMNGDYSGIGTIIRELWDIAYSHGYYDGKIEAEEDIV